MSRAPDVTVVVGSGDNAREFQCYGAILASASPVLDAMLSSGMKESENKTKDPREWEMVLRCMDPEYSLLFQKVMDCEAIYRPEENSR
jgi:sugar (pentulose or hexulose) kinase